MNTQIDATDELSELREQLNQAQASLDAIRSGSVDAFMNEYGNISPLMFSENPHMAYFAAMNEGGLTLDSSGTILHSNPRFAALLDRPIEVLSGLSLFECVAPKDHSKITALLASEETTVCEVLLNGANEPLIVRLSANMVDTGLRPLRCLVVTDLSAQIKAEAELRIAATVFESREGMMVTDANSVILRVNRTFTEMTDYSAEDAIGQSTRLLKSGRHDADFYRVMWECIRLTGAWKGELWHRRKNGEIYPNWLTVSAVRSAEGAVTHYVCVHSDISERKKSEALILELAFFDQLTNLPNRTLLLDRLQQAMAASARSGHYGGLLFIDLDNFKALNDTHGHAKGDALLKQVAERLKLCVRECDTVARLGGDEFVVVLQGLATGAGEAAKGSKISVRKILAALNQPYQLGTGITHQTTASIGITLFQGHLASIDDVMRQADLAMYKSKYAGRNAWHFFDPKMASDMKERTSVEEDLRQALQKKQFQLHYQAQIGGEGKVTGAEALVRWLHPVRGLVPPAEFIALTEETGLILPLGQWVLETACAQLAKWSSQPEMAHLTMAVNVSPHQFRQPDFVASVLAVLKKTRANAHRLKLELTESLLVQDVDDIVEKMSALKRQGVGFSLDDFGTGYSSLNYLKRLPLDQLKIDQSFINDVLTDPNNAAIAKAVVALAHNLGLCVIAEGVETAAQRDFLASSNCHAYQGYYFSRPLPIKGFETFARQGVHAILNGP